MFIRNSLAAYGAPLDSEDRMALGVLGSREVPGSWLTAMGTDPHRYCRSLLPHASSAWDRSG